MDPTAQRSALRMWMAIDFSNTNVSCTYIDANNVLVIMKQTFSVKSVLQSSERLSCMRAWITIDSREQNAFGIHALPAETKSHLLHRQTLLCTKGGLLLANKSLCVTWFRFTSSVKFVIDHYPGVSRTANNLHFALISSWTKNKTLSGKCGNLLPVEDNFFAKYVYSSFVSLLCFKVLHRILFADKSLPILLVYSWSTRKLCTESTSRVVACEKQSPPHVALFQIHEINYVNHLGGLSLANNSQLIMWA